MNISPTDVKRQYDKAKANGWLPHFELIAEQHGSTVAHFLAFASRETNMRNIKGDYRDGQYHGFGPMQVDIGTDPKFAREWSPQNATPGILRGGEIYQEKVDQVTKGQGKRLSVKRKGFTGRQCDADDIRRIATAAYNCGLWAYFHFSNETHIDLSTTGKDYSRDVYDRAILFARLREADGEAGALAREAQLQGKYARDDVKELAAQMVVAKPEPAKETQTVVNVEHADQVEAKTITPLPGAGKDDPPIQASQGGNKSMIATIAGTLGGAVAAVKGFLQGDHTLIIIGVVCATVVLLALIFRQLIMDYLRVKLMSDPQRLNVR